MGLGLELGFWIELNRPHSAVFIFVYMKPFFCHFTIGIIGVDFLAFGARAHATILMNMMIRIIAPLALIFQFSVIMYSRFVSLYSNIAENMRLNDYNLMQINLVKNEKPFHMVHSFVLFCTHTLYTIAYQNK